MNDERPIEKLLRRYAKKRREEAGDPLSVHPATRRLLQGEVARQYPKSSSQPNKPTVTGLFALLVQRWALALGVLVVLGITAAILLPSFKSNSGNEYLAQKKASEDLAVREGLASAPASASATPPAESQPANLSLADSPQNQPAFKPAGGKLRDESATASYAVTNAVSAGSVSRFVDAKTDADSLREVEEMKRLSRSASLGSAAPANRTLTAQSSARSAGEPVVTDSLSVVATSKESLGARADRYNETRQVAAPPPAPAAASVAVSTAALDKNILARGGGVEKDAERFYSQSFANVAPEQLRAQAAKAKSETPAPAVLTKFQVQQVGDQLRVIDVDGSTYLGAMNANFASDTNSTAIAGNETAAYSFKGVKQPAVQTLFGATVAAQQSTQNYSWRVEGTNRSLNQNVVFTWNFVGTTNNFGASQFNAASGALNQETFKLPSQFPALLNNSTINGRAQLGPAQQIEVNAVPVK